MASQEQMLTARVMMHPWVVGLSASPVRW